MSYMTTYDLYNAITVSCRNNNTNQKSDKDKINSDNINLENNEMLKENDKISPLG